MLKHLIGQQYGIFAQLVLSEENTIDHREILHLRMGSLLQCLLISACRNDLHNESVLNLFVITKSREINLLRHADSIGNLIRRAGNDIIIIPSVPDFFLHVRQVYIHLNAGSSLVNRYFRMLFFLMTHIVYSHGNVVYSHGNVVDAPLIQTINQFICHTVRKPFHILRHYSAVLLPIVSFEELLRGFSIEAHKSWNFLCKHFPLSHFNRAQRSS